MKLIYSLLLLFVVHSNTKGQTWDWAFSTNNIDKVKTVISQDSSIYVTGNFYGDSCIINNSIIIQGESGKWNVILVKLTSSGNILWTKIFSSQSIGNVKLLENNSVICIGVNFKGNLSGSVNRHRC